MEIKKSNKAIKQQGNKVITWPWSIGALEHWRGFTLIEMLVAVAILGTVGLVSSRIFFTALRGASKSDVIREVKQNGDYALTVMERMIRNAVDITSVCPTIANSLTIKNLDGNSTTFSLAGGQISSNSASLTNNKVIVSGLSFTCLRTTGKPDVINISFSVAQTGAGAGPEEISSLNFQTTVSLRTY